MIGKDFISTKKFSLKQMMYMLLLFLTIILFSACSANPGEQADEPTNTSNQAPNSSATPQANNSDQPTETEVPPISTEPITLTYYTNVSEEYFELDAELIQEEFPHITLVPTYSSEILPWDLVAAGYVPDLINYTIGSFWDFKQAGMLTDLTPLIKKYNFDTERFLTNVLDSVRSYSDQDEILFVPYNLSTDVLYYNKDLFDRFGVDYPVDGMTWEEVADVARRMAREDEGTEFKGVWFHNQHVLWKNQLMLPLVDPETNRTLINNDGWKNWMEAMGGLYRIPGNEPGGSFYQLNIAMSVDRNIVARLLDLEMDGTLNWDVATMPVFNKGDRIETQLISPFYAISPTNKHPDNSFAVISYMLSEEIQLAKARNGIVPIIELPEAVAQYAQDMEGYTADKNWAAFFEDKVGRAFQTTPYDDIAKTHLYKNVLPQYIAGEEDINTILSRTEEEVNAEIQESLQ